MNEEGSVLVGDFGLAREIYFADYYRTTNPTARLPVKWMAPETLNDSISNEKTDVVSTGTLYHSAILHLSFSNPPSGHMV